MGSAEKSVQTGTNESPLAAEGHGDLGKSAGDAKGSRIAGGEEVQSGGPVLNVSISLSRGAALIVWGPGVVMF